MARSLHIAIAGAGSVGRTHLAAVAASSECRLVALVDPAPAAGATARAAGVPLYGELNAMLAAERPDGVILATPNAWHVEGALACLARGVPVLLEKPVARTLAAARCLMEAVATRAVPVLVGHHRRHGAILEQACAVVAGGRLGRLVTVSGSATFRKPDEYFEQAPWRHQAGGGPILINMVHEVDCLRALVGEITEVQAMASRATRGFEVEDTVTLSLRFANGVLGSFLLSDAAAGPHSWEQTSGENPAYDHHADEDCYVLSGERGSLAVPTLRLRTYDGQASWFEPLSTTRLQVPQADPIRRQLAHFCAVLRGEQAPRVTAEDATRTLAATLAIAESARSGRTVRLNEPGFLV